jgi:two-component system response regulator AtoC
MLVNNLERPMVEDGPSFVVGVSPAIQSVESLVAEIAPTNIPVLLVGESGTGKEVFARRVHRLSGHSERPLLRISCASISPATFFAELGLDQNGNGDATNGMGGTVFFDEISELEGGCQRNLLSVLPDGNAETRRPLLTSRVVSTTSRNLGEEMRAGRFRRELYYRVNGVCLRLPNLRERKEDIPLFAEFFLVKHAAQLGRPRPSLGTRTLQIFLDHSWPGNIRELENVIKKIVVLGDEHLATAELTAAAGETRKRDLLEKYSYSLKEAARAASRETERELILKALARTRWNRKRAAQELQISYKSLLYKLKQIGFEDSDANS